MAMFKVKPGVHFDDGLVEKGIANDFLAGWTTSALMYSRHGGFLYTVLLLILE